MMVAQHERTRTNKSEREADTSVSNRAMHDEAVREVAGLDLVF